MLAGIPKAEWEAEEPTKHRRGYAPAVISGDPQGVPCCTVVPPRNATGVMEGTLRILAARPRLLGRISRLPIFVRGLILIAPSSQAGADQSLQCNGAD